MNGYFAIVTDGLRTYSSRYKCRYLGINGWEALSIELAMSLQ